MFRFLNNWYFLIISWLAWNWKMVYVAIIISKEELGGVGRIDYVLKRYGNENYIFFYPMYTYFLFMFMLILTFIPLFYDYFIDLHKNRNKTKKDIMLDFYRKRRKLKQDVENEQLLMLKELNDLKINDSSEK